MTKEVVPDLPMPVGEPSLLVLGELLWVLVLHRRQEYLAGGDPQFYRQSAILPIFDFFSPQ